MYPKDLAFTPVWLMAIFAEGTENDYINDRNPLVKGNNLTTIVLSAMENSAR